MSAYLVGVIYFTPELRDPGTPILLIGMVLNGAVVVLTIVVLRALLRQAAVLCRVLECQPGDLLEWVDDDGHEGGVDGEGEATERVDT